MSSCPLCPGTLRPCFQVHGYPVWACASCRHQTARIEANSAEHVKQTYGDHYFSGGAAGYSDYLEQGQLIRDRGRTYARLLRQYAPRPGWMLDVGAAAGFILKGFQDEGWQGAGVEPNARMAAVARTATGVEVDCASFEEYRAPRSFDLLSMIQVISHFIDPAASLRRAAALLRPGGLLLVETWDRQSLVARLFGKSWHEYSPPSVLHWFSKDGLSQAAGKQGLRLVTTGRPARSIRAGHAASLLRYKLGDSFAGKFGKPLLGLIPARFTLPYPGDDLFWALYRRGA
jgi:SAM-dependent methyltransferase